MYENFYKEKLKDFIKEDSLILSEFRVANSIADILAINNSITIYEIKSEYDSLLKLPKQIENYKKVANFIYIFVHKRFREKVLKKYKDTDIGILILNNEILGIEQVAKENKHFNFETLFKLLRKNEYLDLFSRFYKFNPKAPNTLIFKYCFNFLSKVSIFEFQKEVAKIIEKRQDKKK